MDFKKDLLIIDTEFSGFDTAKHDLLQIAAVQLDRKTLKEKKVFSTYVKPRHWKNRDPEAMAVNKITLADVKNAPSLEETAKLFAKNFDPKKVITTFYVGYNDKRWLMYAFEKAGLKWPYDYHVFDLWGLFYAFLAAQNGLTSNKHFGGFSLESLLKLMGVKEEGRLHDALVDCRTVAEMLRRVMHKISSKH